MASMFTDVDARWTPPPTWETVGPTKPTRSSPGPDPSNDRRVAHRQRDRVGQIKRVPRRKRPAARNTIVLPASWRSGRVVEGSGFENRRTARYQGFESLLLRRVFANDCGSLQGGGSQRVILLLDRARVRPSSTSTAALRLS